MPVPTSHRPQQHPILNHCAAAVFISLATLLSLTIHADVKHQPWVDEDWTQWTAMDCYYVLTSSPWTYTDSFGSDNFSMSTTAQLRSALPIRQAILRQLQLKKHYDKMNAQEKQAFDQQHTNDLSEANDGPILIYIEISVSLAPTPDGGLHYSYLRAPAAPHATLLLSNNLQVPSIETKTLKNDDLIKEYVYTFPRTVNGKPVYTENEKSIFVFFGGFSNRDAKVNGVQRKQLVLYVSGGISPPVSFPIAPLMYKGKLEY